jgi:RNA-directed DNA polymerase
MIDGVKQPAAEGTPPGSPLSPILPDIMLDDLDRELEQRSHRFVRYADDLRVFVRSERAAQRVSGSACGVIEQRLKLKVNREKSSIRHAAQATLLGFGFFLHGTRPRIRVAPQAVTRLKDQLRTLTRRNWSVSMEHRIGRINRFITGWMAYFHLADTGNLAREMDKWLRRRLRQIRWKEWKTTAAKRHNLRIRGIAERNAPQMGRKQQGILAGCGLPGPVGGPAQRLPGTPRPENPDTDPAATQPNGLTNRRMRARMSGGVRGGGETPPPTRS